MHFEISRSTAAMSITFILSITPWAFKEAVIACIGGKVSFNIPSIAIFVLCNNKSLEIGMMIVRKIIS